VAFGKVGGELVGIADDFHSLDNGHVSGFRKPALT
jgi:hypothetical protein